jgi:adenosine deaminase
MPKNQTAPNQAFLSTQQLRRMPKVELHRHLDCCMRWSTIVELAPQVGIELPKTLMKQQEAFLVLDPMKDLSSVLKKFHNVQKILSSEEIITRLAYEACEDAFNDNVLICEFRYAPSFIAEGHSNLTYDKIHQAILKGLRMAEKKWPMATGLICTLQRIRDLPFNENVCQFAIDHHDTLIGLDMADDDLGFDEKKFIPLFDKARASGLRITAHAGESPFAGAVEQIRNCVDHWGAERIGHGVQIITDSKAMLEMKQKNIVFEVCPVSNYLTKAFPTYSGHPLRKLLEAGLKVTINSDDPGVFGTVLTNDYEIAHQYHGVTEEEFQKINQTAAETSFIPLAQRQSVWAHPLAK